MNPTILDFSDHDWMVLGVLIILALVFSIGIALWACFGPAPKIRDDE